MGKVFVISLSNPGSLSQIDPTQPAGSVTTLTSALGPYPEGIAFDGQNIWVANTSNLPGTGSVSKVSLNPINVVTFTTSFNQPVGILFDGSNIWLTDKGDNTIKKLGSNGAVLLSIGVGSSPRAIAFDGTNIWVPNSFSNTVTVVRATGGLSGTVLATRRRAHSCDELQRKQSLLVEGIRSDSNRDLLYRSRYKPRGSVQRRIEFLGHASRHEQTCPVLKQRPVCIDTRWKFC